MSSRQYTVSIKLQDKDGILTKVQNLGSKSQFGSNGGVKSALMGAPKAVADSLSRLWRRSVHALYFGGQ